MREEEVCPSLIPKFDCQKVQHCNYWSTSMKPLIKSFYGVMCLSCKDVIWSRSVHDFRYCSCRKSFIDGGRDYLRYGGEAYPAIKPVQITLLDKEDVP